MSVKYEVEIRTTADARKAAAENLGCRSITKARSTGAFIGIYDGEPAGLDVEAGRWQTICEDHGFVCSHETLAIARAFASAPESWCEECVKPAELRETEAYADDPEGATKLWESGFHPLRAYALRPGMTVAFRTFLLHDDGSGQIGSTVIGDVLADENEGTITVSTFDRGNVEVDEDAEVWVR